MDNGDHIDAARTSADDELVAELRRLAAALDRAPDDVRAAARAAITTRDLDSELAALVADSAVDDASDPGSDPELLTLAFEPVRTGTAGMGRSRLLSFAGNGIQVDLEVTEHGGRADLIGMFTGASFENCVLEYASGGQRTLDVDSLGRFLVTGVRRGLVRTRCRSAAGVRVVTAWVTI